MLRKQVINMSQYTSSPTTSHLRGEDASFTQHSTVGSRCPGRSKHHRQKSCPLERHTERDKLCWKVVASAEEKDKAWGAGRQSAGWAWGAAVQERAPWKGDLWAKITRREAGGLSGPGATSPGRGNSPCISQAEMPPGGQCGWSRAARSAEERRLGEEGVG